MCLLSNQLPPFVSRHRRLAAEAHHFRPSDGRTAAAEPPRHSPLTAHSSDSVEVARDTSLNLASELKAGAEFDRQGAVDERAAEPGHGKNAWLPRVGGGEHLVPDARDGARTRVAALELDESKVSRRRVPALDVVATVAG